MNQKNKNNTQPAEKSVNQQNTATIDAKFNALISRKWFSPVFFLVLALLYFLPYLSFDKIIMGTDDGPRSWYTVGNHGHGIESFKDKWSPLNGGTAMMEQRSATKWINPTYLFHMFLPKYQARILEYIFWTFIAGFFMFLFLRALGVSQWASYLCAAGYMLAPALQSFIFAGHFARMEVMALMPGAMFFAERMLKKASLIDIAGLPIIMALCVYSEHLQFAYFVFLGMGIYFAIRIIYSYIKKEISLNEGIRRSSFFAVALVFGFLLSAVCIIPPMHHTQVTSKRAGGVDYEYAASFALHPEELFTLAQPDFIGWKEFYWGQNPLKLNNEYFGIVFLLLGIMLFIFKKQNFTKYLFAGYFVFAVLFTLGAHTPLHKILFYILPGMKSFRAPSQMFIWFFFCGLVLAAYSLDDFFQYNLKENRLLKKRFLIFSGIVVGLAFLYMIGSKGFANYWYSSIFPAELQSENNYNALTHNLKQIQGGAVIVFFIIAALFTLLYLKAQGIINHTTFVLLLLAVVLIDLFRISRPFLTQCTKPKNYFVRQEQVEHSIATYLKSLDKSIYRVYSMLGDDKFYVPGLEMTWIFDDFIDKKYHEIAQALRMAAHALNQPEYASNQTVQSRFRNALSLLNTKYIITLSELKVIGLREVINSGGLRIYENPYVLPRFYLADDIVPEFDAGDAVMKTVDSPLFRQNTAVVDKKLWAGKTLDASADSTITDNITIATYDPRKGYSQVKVSSSREQILVISENNSPGWKATLNNKPVDIFDVNYISKGVIVPKGVSELKLAYNSPVAEKWRKVTVISAIIFLLFSLFALFVEVKNRQDH